MIWERVGDTEEGEKPMGDVLISRLLPEQLGLSSGGNTQKYKECTSELSTERQENGEFSLQLILLG